MKIRLPLALANKGEKLGFDEDDDNASCSSATSDRSSLSLRSFSLSPRNRRKSRQRSQSLQEDSTNAGTLPPKELRSPRSRRKLRSRSRSFREESLNTTSNTPENSHSPTKKPPIMRRFQKSYFHKQKNNVVFVGQEKENTLPNANILNDSTDLSIDSTIDSRMEDYPPHSLSGGFPAPIALEVETRKSQTEISSVRSLEEEVIKALPPKEEMIDGNIKIGEETETDSPTSLATGGSLLPPLFDSDDEEEVVFSTAMHAEEQSVGGCNEMLGGQSEEVFDSHRKAENIGNQAVASRANVEQEGNCSVEDASTTPDAQHRTSRSCDSSLSAVKSVSQSIFNESDDDSTCHLVAVRKSKMIPPKEVVAITSYPSPMTPLKTPNREQGKRDRFVESPASLCESYNTAKLGTNSGMRNKSYHEDKEEETRTAHELAVKLVADLEALREENERFESKNRRLETKFQIMKAQQDEHMIHRGRLVKACLYTMPVFVLCGGLDAFLATILLVWVLVEVDGYLDLNDEAGDADDGDGGADSDDENDLDDVDDDNYDENSSIDL